MELQRKIEILEDLEGRFKQIFEHFTPSVDEATDLQYDAFADLMVRIDNYVDETTEEEYELGDEFVVALIDLIYPEADNVSSGKIMLNDNSLETVSGLWLEGTPLKTWLRDYDSEALDTCRYLLRKFKAMARGERLAE